MNFEKLFNMQFDLDMSINAKHNTNYFNTFHKRVLAFIVELGEFANETRCFKYWSLKGPSEKDVILEEYIDGIHFILSIGLAIEVNKTFEFSPVHQTNDLTTQLLTVYKLATKLDSDAHFMNYIELFNNFLGLADILGFTFEDIESMYLKKNEINYKRQENNY